MLWRKQLAAILREAVNGLFVGSRPLPITLSPLTLLSGHNRSPETKWSSARHLLMSHPASLMTVGAVLTSIPSIRVRSVPVMRNNSARRSNRGLFSFFLRSRSGRFSSGRSAPALRSFSRLRYSLQLLVTFSQLRQAELITILFLLQQKQQIFLPISLQALRDLFLARLYAFVPKFC